MGLLVGANCGCGDGWEFEKAMSDRSKAIPTIHWASLSSPEKNSSRS